MTNRLRFTNTRDADPSSKKLTPENFGSSALTTAKKSYTLHAQKKKQQTLNATWAVNELHNRFNLKREFYSKTAILLHCISKFGHSRVNRSYTTWFFQLLLMGNVSYVCFNKKKITIKERYRTIAVLLYFYYFSNALFC